MIKTEEKRIELSQNKEHIGKGNVEEGEIETEETDLQCIPKELLDKLNAGTLTEEEEEEIKRLIIM